VAPCAAPPRSPPPTPPRRPRGPRRRRWSRRTRALAQAACHRLRRPAAPEVARGVRRARGGGPATAAPRPKSAMALGSWTPRAAGPSWKRRPPRLAPAARSCPG